MRKFRSLLLSMAMLVTVCPLYGFTPANGDGQTEKDPSSRVVGALTRAIEKIEAAHEEVAPLAERMLEGRALHEEKDALEYIQDAYQIKADTEADMAAAETEVGNAETAVNGSFEAMVEDGKTIGAAWADAYKQDQIANNAWTQKQANAAANAAFDDAKAAGNALRNAWAAKKAADEAASTARAKADAAQTEYDDAQAAIDEAVANGLKSAEQAAADTKKAKERLEKIKDALKEADDKAAAAQAEAEEAYEDALEVYEPAKAAFEEAVKEYNDAVKDGVQNAAATGISFEMAIDLTEKAFDIVDEYGDDPIVVDKLEEFDSQLKDVRDKIDELLENGDLDDYPFAKKVAFFARVGLTLTTTIKNNYEDVDVSITPEEEYMRPIHHEAVEGLKDAATDEDALEAIKDTGADYFEALPTMASAAIAYNVTTAAAKLTNVLYTEADEEYEAAKKAYIDADRALYEVNKVADKGIKIDAAALENAQTAAERTEKKAADLEKPLEAMGEFTRATGAYAYDARQAAQNFTPKQPAQQGRRFF